MRNLLILVGTPGSGKSTWLKENNLEQYVLCPDTFRLMYESPIVELDGSLGISQRKNQEIWGLLYSFLEKRMIDGHFTIIDATNTNDKVFSKYKSLAKKYRYRTWIKKFDVPLDKLIERNLQRGYKNVKPNVVERFYNNYSALSIPKSFKEITDISEIMEYVKYEDVSGKYESIFYVGDIHGNGDTLEFFLNNFYSEKSLYIFLGDYFDRGNQKLKTFSLLFNLFDRSNCIFLEGNHESYLRKYFTIKEYIKRKQPLETLNEFKNSGIEKSLKKFVRCLNVFNAISFNDKKILSCHGGISTPSISFIASNQLIHGVGNYQEYQDIAESFQLNSEMNMYQVHGHRNTENTPIDHYSRVFNLCASVNEGIGMIRVTEFNKKEINHYYIQNEIIFKTNSYGSKFQRIQSKSR